MRKTKRIDTESWHYRVLYKYWLDNSGASKPYVENMCHYRKVLFFLAPYTWLLNAGFGGTKRYIRPITTILTLLVIWMAISVVTMDIDIITRIFIGFSVAYVAFGAVLGIEDFVIEDENYSLITRGNYLLLAPLLYPLIWCSQNLNHFRMPAIVSSFLGFIGNCLYLLGYGIYKILEFKIIKVPIWVFVCVGIVVWLGFINTVVFWEVVQALFILVLMLAFSIVLAFIVLWASTNLFEKAHEWKTKKVLKRIEQGHAEKVPKEKGISIGRLILSALTDLYYQICPYAEFFSSKTN